MSVNAIVQSYVIDPVVPFTTLQTISLPVTGAAGTVPVSQGVGLSTVFQALPASDLSTVPVLAPATSARNVIQGTADVTELTLKAFAGQGSPPFAVLDSGGGILGGYSTLGAMISKGFQAGVNAKSGNYTLTGGDFYVPVDSTAAPVTITLPTETGSVFANHYHVSKVDASVNAVTIVPAGGQSINGGNVVLSNQFDMAILQGDGVSAWGVLKTASTSPSGAVILEPNTLTRNVVTPTADNISPLILKAHSPTQGASFLTCLLSDGVTVAAQIGPTGSISATELQGFQTDPTNAFLVGAAANSTDAGTSQVSFIVNKDAGGASLNGLQIFPDGSLEWDALTTTSFRSQARIIPSWRINTDATRAAQFSFQLRGTGAGTIEALKLSVTGSSSPMIGFLGAAAAVRQTGGAATANAIYGATEQAMLQAAYDALRTFGFLT